MNANRNISITRPMIGAFASVIGFGGVIACIVAWISQGTLTPLGFVLLIIGVIGLIGWALLQPDEFRAFITGKSVRFGTGTILAGALLVGIVAMTYVLASRASLTWDMTVAQRFSLSETSLDILSRVTRPIQITGFYTSQALNLQESDDQFFRLYTAATDGLISRVYYDPEEVPAIAEQFAFQQDGQVYISYLNEDGSVDFSSLSRVFLSGTQERDMTQAVSRLLVAGTLTVFFDTGLGERDPIDSSAEGISGLNNGVRESGLITYPVNIVELAQTNGDIPANASAVVFARPLRDLTTPEIAVLDRYLNRGGSLLLLADLSFTEDRFMAESGAFNQYLWENYGIRALDRAVVDFGAFGQTPLDIIGAVLFDETELAANLDPGTNPTLFRLARAVDVNLESAPQDMATGRLFMSSHQSYGEIDLTTLGQTNTYEYDAGVDAPGAQSLVVWAWDQETDGRIMLIGDSDFVSNGQVLLTNGNGILFTNAISWLSRLDERIRFAPQTFGVSVPVFVDQATRQFIVFLVVILIPGIVLISGIAIYARRVRR